MKLNKDLLKKVSKITGWTYEDDLIEEEVEDIIEDLIYRCECFDEQVEELEEDIKYNYRAYSERELIGG